jgi:hypothetical protein
LENRIRASATGESRREHVAEQLESTMEMTGRGGPITRELYMIDRFRVVFESGGGWICACADFLASNSCRHSREAAGRRAAQVRIASLVANPKSPLPNSVGSRRPPLHLANAGRPAPGS